MKGDCFSLMSVGELIKVETENVLIHPLRPADSSSLSQRDSLRG